MIMIVTVGGGCDMIVTDDGGCDMIVTVGGDCDNDSDCWWWL